MQIGLLSYHSCQCCILSVRDFFKRLSLSMRNGNIINVLNLLNKAIKYKPWLLFQIFFWNLQTVQTPGFPTLEYLKHIIVFNLSCFFFSLRDISHLSIYLLGNGAEVWSCQIQKHNESSRWMRLQPSGSECIRALLWKTHTIVHTTGQSLVISMPKQVNVFESH